MYRLKVIDHWSFGCDFPTRSKKATVFGVEDPLKVFFHPSHTQKALPCVKTRRLSHQPSISVQAFDLCTCARKKKGWIKLKKGQKCYISRMCPEVPRQPNATKICIYYDANDVITCAKFGDDWFRGFLLPAVQKCPFPIKVVVTITTACTSVQPWLQLLHYYRNQLDSKWQ